MNISAETETHIILKLTLEETRALKEATSCIIHIDHNSKAYGIVDEIDERLHKVLDSVKEEGQ